MHRRTLLTMVQNQAEGQLLQQTVQQNLVAGVTNTLKTVVDVGRGDVVAYAVSFNGEVEADIDGLFSVSINGKESQENMKNVRFGNIPTINGTSQRPKVHILIPEGSTVQVDILPDAIPNAAAVVLDLFFTDAFLPYVAPITYAELFEITIPPLSTGNSEKFVIPKKRGHIVGIELSTVNTFSDFTDPSVRGTVEINGVSIIEDFSLVRYSPWQNALRINNWVTNIKGGGVIRLSNKGSGNLVATTLAATLFFSQDVSKKYIEKRKESPILE